MSEITGISHTMDLDVTEEQLIDWRNGKLIQKVMSHLTREEREFLITGITPEEWDNTFMELEE